MSPRGTVRVVQGLTRAPERLAWSGATLFVLMPGERVAENEVARRVYSITATPGMLGGWEYIPADRPETLPNIAGKWGARDLSVIGFAATPAAPAVLMHRQSGPTDGYLLLVLAGTEWVQATLPWDDDPTAAPAPQDRCRLITAGQTFGILIERAGSDVGDWHSASADDLSAIPVGDVLDESPHPVTAKVRWTKREVKIDPPGRTVSKDGNTVSRDTIFCIENQLVRLTQNGSDVTISVLGAQDEFVSATLNGIGADVHAAPVEGNSGFLALMWETKGAKKSPGAGPGAEAAETSYQLLEITPRGAELYRGPAKQGGPVSPREIQLLSLMLVLVMAAVVVFVLRPDKMQPAGLIALPAGYMPAEGGRRVMASVLDLGASWIVASLVVRLDISDFARPDVLLGTPRGWQAVVLALGVTIAMGTVMEWQLGTTIGKMMLGCRVLGVHDAPGGQPGAEGNSDSAPKLIASDEVTFRAAAWRNIGKWMPWNIVEFLATGRHRPWADRVSGTLVVVTDNSERGSEG
jgi:hypothetical protein